MMHMNYSNAQSDIQALQSALRSLPNEVSNYIHGEMMNAAAGVVRNSARATPRFKDRTGNLRKSIRTNRFDVVVDGQVVKGGGSRVLMGGRRARHSILIERGTTTRVQKTTGRKTGQVSARNVLQTALTTNEDRAFNAAVRKGRTAFNQMARAVLANGRTNRRLTRAIIG